MLAIQGEKGMVGPSGKDVSCSYENIAMIMTIYNLRVMLVQLAIQEKREIRQVHMQLLEGNID